MVNTRKIFGLILARSEGLILESSRGLILVRCVWGVNTRDLEIDTRKIGF